MRFVYFKENKDVLLCQILENIPIADEIIKLKGRKGKVIQVEEIQNNKVNVIVQLEKKIKNHQPLIDKRKRR